MPQIAMTRERAQHASSCAIPELDHPSHAASRIVWPSGAKLATVIPSVGSSTTRSCLPVCASQSLALPQAMKSAADGRRREIDTHQFGRVTVQDEPLFAGLHIPEARRCVNAAGQHQAAIAIDPAAST